MILDCSAVGGSTGAETNPARTATNAPLQTSVVAHQTDGARETSTTRRPIALSDGRSVGTPSH